MLQVAIKKGTVVLEDVPAPIVSKGTVLIKVSNSCISPGTELSFISRSGESIYEKALAKPEKVIGLIKNLKSVGLSNSIKKINRIRTKDNFGVPSGYSIAGTVVEVGENQSKFKIGDKVAAAGAGIANHAEYVNVPVNLVMPVPDGLELAEASTVTLGGIALQGVRRANLKLGEFCAVIGAGALGLLTIQLLQNSGVRVITSDIDNNRLNIAKSLGAELIINPNEEDLLRTIEVYTRGYGVDAVIFTASTNNHDVLSMSFQMCRKKGKVILVGVAGDIVKRDDIYRKELDYLVSTSYGPGRYDSNYEEKGIDYPYAYVRWTENRNMEEYLRLLKEKKIKLDCLINGVFKINKAAEAFDFIKNNIPKPLFILLDYRKDTDEVNDNIANSIKRISLKSVSKDSSIINVGLVGTGSFAVNMHLPNLHKLNNKYKIYAIMNRTGLKAKNLASYYDAAYATTNYDEILADKNIDLVLICTRHDSHAELILRALNAGKHVFVEKPLAVNEEELNQIVSFYTCQNESRKPLLMVGFNRRFSRYAKEIKKSISKRVSPLFIHYRMNAGFIPYDSWVHESGGRIVGEACHIVDLMTYFTESRIMDVSVQSINYNKDNLNNDNKSFILKYADGSVCTIEYFSIGNKSFPKEYLEIHFEGKTIVMDDYKSLKGYGIKVNEIQTKNSEKGQYEELDMLYDYLMGNSKGFPIPLNEIFETTETTLLLNA